MRRDAFDEIKSLRHAALWEMKNKRGPTGTVANRSFGQQLHIVYMNFADAFESKAELAECYLRSLARKPYGLPRSTDEAAAQDAAARIGEQTP